MAVKNRELKETFSKEGFKRVCPKFKESTHRNFLRKHKIGNSGDETELFEEVLSGKFKVVRPFKYGLNC